MGAFFTWFSAFLLALVLVVLHRLLIKPYRLIQFYKRQKLPVFVKSLKGFIDYQWGLVTTHDDFYYFQKQLIKQNRSERAFVTNIGPKPTVYLIEPTLIKEFLMDKHDCFEKAPLIGLLKRFGDRGLFMLEGQEWKQRRKIISEAFRYDLLREMVTHVVKVTEERFQKFSIAAKNKEELNIIKEFEFMAGEVVGRFFLGKSFTDINVDGTQITAWISDLFVQVIYESVSLWTLTFGPSFVAKGILPHHKELVSNVRRGKAITREFINQRREALLKDSTTDKEQKDLLTILLAQQAENQLTTEDIIDEYLTFLIAGMDTSARLETLALYFISQNPQCLPRLKEEISKAFEEPSQVTLEKLNQMEYFTAFLKETLRMAPPSPHITFRTAIKDVMLKDIMIKKGTWTTVCK